MSRLSSSQPKIIDAEVAAIIEQHLPRSTAAELFEAYFTAAVAYMAPRHYWRGIDVAYRVSRRKGFWAISDDGSISSASRFATLFLATLAHGAASGIIFTTATRTRTICLNASGVAG